MSQSHSLTVSHLCYTVTCTQYHSITWSHLQILTVSQSTVFQFNTIPISQSHTTKVAQLKNGRVSLSHSPTVTHPKSWIAPKSIFITLCHSSQLGRCCTVSLYLNPTFNQSQSHSPRVPKFHSCTVSACIKWQYSVAPCGPWPAVCQCHVRLEISPPVS